MKVRSLVFFLFTLCSCATKNIYKVQFEKFDGPLSVGQKVYISGLDVGDVKKIDKLTDEKILVTVEVDKSIKIASGSKFQLRAELLGSYEFEIDPIQKGEAIKDDEIQLGLIIPLIPINSKPITEYQWDSLKKVDSKYKLADTIFTIFKEVKKNLEKKK